MLAPRASSMRVNMATTIASCRACLESGALRDAWAAQASTMPTHRGASAQPWLFRSLRAIAESAWTRAWADYRQDSPSDAPIQGLCLFLFYCMTCVGAHV